MQLPPASLLPGLSSSASAISDAIAVQTRVGSTRPSADVIDVTPVQSSQSSASQAGPRANLVDDATERSSSALMANELSDRLSAKLEYDQNTQTSRGAIGQYLMHQHAAQRDAISQMVGIDTYV
ncbi:hypothetical protein [Shewanella marisflavi]|uniref:Uncharacterized protein n=1 Tax=Shewanella marisflavi TaxID=260364 RepID=A0AAC9TZ65_9GAMM|nr:hypothetical protein [Shewanella marisflavi]ASJ96583.1 hypothetical protein CFF01_08260 [Shewanella marisflavi]